MESAIIGLVGVIIGAGIQEVGAHFRTERQKEATDKRVITRQLMENQRHVAQYVLGRKVDLLLDCYADLEAVHREITRYTITINEGKEYEHSEDIIERYDNSIEAVRRVNVFLPSQESEKLYNFLDEVRKANIHIQNESDGPNSEYLDEFDEDDFHDAYSEARKVIESELRGPIERLNL